MLLTELNMVPPAHEQLADKIVNRSQRSGSGASTLGKGNWGTAISQPHETNSVLKIGRFNRDNPDSDGYYQFVNRVREMDNPYFPQIDVVKTVKGGKMYKVRMERLTPLRDLSRDELFALIERSFGYEPTIRVTKGMTEKEIDEEVLYWITINILSIVNGKKQMPINANDNFKQAMGVLSAMYKEGFGEDINSGNMMVRRTKYGPQLVITDPFTHLISANDPEHL